MCHHYKGARNPPEHLRDEFSIRSNQYQLLLDAGFYPLAQVPIIRQDDSGERESNCYESGRVVGGYIP